MPSKKFKKVIQDAPFDQRMAGIGSLLLFISVFLPWYKDLDTFKTGDIFLGINGPLYFGGFSLMLLAGIVFILVLFNAYGKKHNMGFKLSSLELFTGIFSFYLLMLINSVYFHPQFGVNIALKDSEFGVFIAYLASSLITIGGYLASRKKVNAPKKKDAKPVFVPDSNLNMNRKSNNGIKDDVKFTSTVTAPVSNHFVPVTDEKTKVAVGVVSSINNVSKQPQRVVDKPSNELKEEAPRKFQPFRTDL